MVFRKNGLLFVAGLGALSFMAGCARYSAKPLNKLNSAGSYANEGSEKKPEKTVSLAYHVFDRNDCKAYLDRDVLKKGYQPVHVTVTNNSDRYINIAKSNFSLPTVSAADVAKRVHTSTLARATSYGVAGLFLWPFLIPAVVDGVKSSEANRKLDEDFVKKEFPDQVMAPFSSANGLIFVPKNEFRQDFTITAVDVEKRTRLVLNSHKTYLKI